MRKELITASKIKYLHSYHKLQRYRAD